MQGTSERERSAIWLVIAMTIVMILDNQSARPNQGRAVRANVGFGLFLLGTFIAGWVSVVFALTGAILAMRPRAGSQLKAWPIILVTLFVLYVWFDVVAPMVPQLLELLGAYVPWASRFLIWLFNGDNIRPVAIIIYLGTLFLATLQKTIDTTTLIVLGITLLGWKLAFGVYPYLDGFLPAWVDTLMFWGTLILISIAMLVEHTQSNSGPLAVGIVVLFGIGYLIAQGIRALTDATPNSFWWTLTTPLTFSLLLVAILAIIIGQILKKGDESVEKFLQVATSWTGQFAQIGAVALPTDAFITAGIILFTLLVATNLPLL